MKNMFEIAIKEGQLLEFAMGDGNYFIPDREYGGHWVYESWKLYILSYIKEHSNNEVIDNLTKMFLLLINDKCKDYLLKSDLLLYHTHVFYYMKKEKYFEINYLKDLKEKLIEYFEIYSDFLRVQNPEKYSNVINAINIIKLNGLSE